MEERNKINSKQIMQYIASITIAIFLLSSCGSNKAQKDDDNKIEYSTLKFEKESDDSLEYEIYINDIGYDTFLITQRPMDFYSQRYYENWNRYYVTDWNQKVQTSLYHSAKYQNVFEMFIDYDPSIDYGMEVNYKLYNYFMFVEKRYGVRFNIPRAINY